MYVYNKVVTVNSKSNHNTNANNFPNDYFCRMYTVM